MRAWLLLLVLLIPIVSAEFGHENAGYPVPEALLLANTPAPDP